MATQWALDHCKEYGIVPSKSTLDFYQEYIYSYMDDEDKDNLALKKKLLLKFH